VVAGPATLSHTFLVAITIVHTDGFVQMRVTGFADSPLMRLYASCSSFFLELL